MANRIKKGLIYFPDYVDELTELPILRLIHQHKGNGYLIYRYILKAVFKNGYLMEWQNDSPFIIANHLGLNEGQVKEVVRYCCYLGFFSKELLDRRSVLTSRIIQEEYLDICKRSKRKPMQILQEICLIPPEILPDFDHKEEANFEVYERNFYEEKIKTSEEIVNFSEELPKTSEETAKNSEEMKQSKVKKRKENFNYIFSSFPEKIKSKVQEEILAAGDEKFIELIFKWLEYKETAGEPYKTLASVRGCITKMRKIHPDNTVVEAKVELAIQQGWQGCFWKAGEKEVRLIRKLGLQRFLNLKQNDGEEPQKGEKNETTKNNRGSVAPVGSHSTGWL